MEIGKKNNLIYKYLSLKLVENISIGLIFKCHF